MTINLKSLIAKLDLPTRKAMESAANVALSRTHHEVDIEHVLLELLSVADGDLLRILKAYRVDAVRLESDLTQALDHFRTGNTRNPVLSRNILRWLETAWLAASVNDGADRLGSGYLLLALVSDEELLRLMASSCAALKKLPADDLKDNLPAILRASGKALGKGQGAAQTGADENPEDDDAAAINRAHTRNSPNLDKYTIDLTALARAGKIDPVLGRDGEIRQMIDILLRRRQNNPILTGEPGVGKTAVVEGLALRIVEGDIPDVLANITLRTLDLGLLQAGASVKGEFENRLRSVIDEVKASLKPIILFIDEAHTLIGAGGSAGQNDAANLLKPALARGELRTIAATTWSEYKKYFEKDAALARRFQVVKIDEPTEDAAVQMLRGIANAMEAHHQVRILDEAVEEAVKLSSRYISGRQLPDKAISVLDTACARVALSRASKPAAVEDVERMIQNIDRETAALKKEHDPAHDKRLTELAARRVSLEKDLETNRAAFAEQKTLVDEVMALRVQLNEAVVTASDKPAKKNKEATKNGEKSSVASPAAASHATLRTRLLENQRKLHELHQKQPLIYECVDGATVADVISGWTGIPLGGMVANEIDTVRNLHRLLEARVVGQTHALELIARRIQIAKANLEDPGKPKGVFLLVGPSGVGKTESALALADTLYGGERNLITINMSEYQEAHTVSGLKGSPPGYVGYGEGGVLTEAVRRKPYSVVLLDEVEKAHPDVLELFFQVFDKGVLEDAEGREVDFKNTIIILTSNVGTDQIMSAVEHGVTVDGKCRQPTPEDLLELLRPSLQRAFKPAFLGRLSVIPYYPISDEIMRLIVSLKLGKVKQRLFTNHGARLSYDQALVDLIVARCTEVDSGARDAEAIITDTVLAQVSDQVLERMAQSQTVQTVDLKIRKDKLVVVVK